MANDIAGRVLTEAVKLAPQILWFILAVIALALFYQPLRDALIKGGIGKVSFGPIQLELIQKEVAKSDPSGLSKEVLIDAAQFGPIGARIERTRAQLFGARILWLDDNHPSQNIRVRNALAQMGVSVDPVASSDAAFQLLPHGNYDLVITDMRHGADKSAGTVFVAALHERDPDLPVIIYLGDLDRSRGTPPYAFRITNRRSELFHSIMDILERSPTRANRKAESPN